MDTLQRYVHNLRLSLLSSKTRSAKAPRDPQISPFFRLPLEIRTIVYAHVLQGTEQPLFLIENSKVWRCAPRPAFTHPGPPSLLRVCNLIAQEASQVLHEVRELRVMVVSQGFPTGAISCYHRFCSLENFVPVLERVQRLTLIVNAHPWPRVEERYMRLLDCICTRLEERVVPIRYLGFIVDCRYGDGRRACDDTRFDLARRFQDLQPSYVEYRPRTANCTWGKVKQTQGRYKRAAVAAELDYLVPMGQPGIGYHLVDP